MSSLSHVKRSEVEVLTDVAVFPGRTVCKTYLLILHTSIYSITYASQVMYYPPQELMINVLQKGSVSSAAGTQGGQSDLSSPAGEGSHCQQATITRSGSMIKWASNEAGKMKSR